MFGNRKSEKGQQVQENMVLQSISMSSPERHGCIQLLVSVWKAWDISSNDSNAVPCGQSLVGDVPAMFYPEFDWRISRGDRDAFPE